MCRNNFYGLTSDRATADVNVVTLRIRHACSSDTVGKHLANAAPDAVNLWTEYELSNKFEVGVGGNYLRKRYADFAEQAILPSYVLVNAMAS